MNDNSKDATRLQFFYRDLINTFDAEVEVGHACFTRSILFIFLLMSFLTPFPLLDIIESNSERVYT